MDPYSDTAFDDRIRAAVEPFRDVRASAALRAAVLDGPSEAPAPRRRSVRPRLALAAAVAAAAALVAVVAVVADDLRQPTGDPGPIDLQDMQTIAFADGTTVDVDDLFDPSQHSRLQVVFEQHGAELVIDERPVAPTADGRVFGVTVSNEMADQMASHTIELRPGGKVVVDIGRADDSEETAGLTLYEVFPEIEDAVDRNDPRATGAALAQLGFEVNWVLIEGPGEGHPVDAPPEGTRIISVLGPEGQWTDVERANRTLMVEVATPEVADALGH